MSDGTAGGLGLLVLVPFFGASLWAVVVGLVYAIRFYRHWLLVVLAMLSLLYMAEFLTEYGSVRFYNATPVLYGVTADGLSLRWFLMLRTRTEV